MAQSLAVGYVRVSTDDQADSGLGLQAQRTHIEAECQRREWALVRTFEDAGASGRTLNRPGVAAALGAVGSGEASVLVVAKLDRLSRSLLDFAGLMDRARHQGWNLVALDLGIDLSTPAGEFLASVMASAAQWERRIIGQRTREALAAKRESGIRLGRPVSLSERVEDRIILERTTGASLQTIADGLNADGVPTAQGGQRWYPSTVQAVVRRLSSSSH